MRTMFQFEDVLLVISIYLGGTFPQHNKTSINAISATDCLMYPTIIRPCLRQFSFKFCDHRSPLPRPLIFLTQPHFVGLHSFMDTVQDIAIAQNHTHTSKILQQAQAHKQDIATSTTCLLKGDAKACPA